MAVTPRPAASSSRSTPGSSAARSTRSPIVTAESAEPANPAQAPSASAGATATSPMVSAMSRRGKLYRTYPAAGAGGDRSTRPTAFHVAVSAWAAARSGAARSRTRDARSAGPWCGEPNGPRRTASAPRTLRIPGVGFRVGILAPGIERVVDQESGRQLRVIVAIHPGEAERDGLQPGRLRRKLEMRGVGAPDDDGHLLQCGVVEPVLLEEGVEAALGPVVGELDALDVERGRALARRPLQHLRGLGEEEFRLGVNEPGDEPRAGDPVHLGPFAGDPFHRGLRGWGGAGCREDSRRPALYLVPLDGLGERP